MMKQGHCSRGNRGMAPHVLSNWNLCPSNILSKFWVWLYACLPKIISYLPTSQSKTWNRNILKTIVARYLLNPSGRKYQGIFFSFLGAFLFEWHSKLWITLRLRYTYNFGKGYWITMAPSFKLGAMSKGHLKVNISWLILFQNIYLVDMKKLI